MSLRDGLLKARSHIAWILALAVSTAVIVRLEQLEVGPVLPAGGQAGAAVTSALTGLHRLAAAGDMSPETAAALLIAAQSNTGLTQADIKALQARANENPAVAKIVAPLGP